MGIAAFVPVCQPPAVRILPRSARWLVALALLWGSGFALAPAQTVLLDFNTAGQYTGNFNPWNDAGGANGGNYAFIESASAGAGGSGAVSVFQSTDTTAAYKSGSWDFSTNGATVIFSTLIKANGQTSGDKIQLGLMNVNNNGLNNNSGVAFESYRFVPSSATVWSLREQYRSADVLVETTLGNVSIIAGHWYKFLIGLTNTSGVSGPGAYGAGCALFDYGADGQAPGADVLSFSTITNHAGQDIAQTTTTWPAFRAFQDAGIDSWDNFLVYTPSSKPVFTLQLTNSDVLINQPATFYVLADGPGTTAYAWYTNGLQVSGASGSSYTTPPVGGGLNAIAVVASNSNGSVTNQASITVVQPAPAQVMNLPASGVQVIVATLNGQITSTGGDAPSVTIFYGPSDGGTTPSAWAAGVGIGVQSGAFSQPVSGLAPGTTCYFTARAINSAGTSWAAPSQSFSTLSANPTPTSVAVMTQHNDNGRTGANLSETLLNTSNVNTNQFGLLFSRAVDDQVYAQPLVMTNVNVPGKGPRNVVYVATVNDSLYAYDADDSTVTAPYWSRSFINPPNIVAPRNTDAGAGGACGGNYNDFSGNMGLVGTPVIDPIAGTLFVVVRTKEILGTTTNYVQRLHALDVTSGAERPTSPVVITFGGFDTLRQNPRPGLLLVNGTVYISWSSHCDWTPYHGLVVGYNATNLLQAPVIFNATPSGSEAGIWMSGQGLSADANGNIYFVTGNGTFDAASNFGECFMKLAPGAGGLNVASWFCPFNYVNLNNGDLDLGTSGLLLIPGTSLCLAGGKAGTLYLVNRDNMGGLSGSTTADTNIVQSWSLGSHAIHGGPVWWTAPNGSFTYVWAASADHLRQYQFTNSTRFNTVPYSQSRTVGGPGQPGGTLALSANGNTAGSGILWACVNTSANANQAVVAGTLHAYDAQNVTNELWNSDLLPVRDSLGNYPKFVAPTVANGKVYMATFSNQLKVYGLLPPPPLTITLAGPNAVMTWPTNSQLNYVLQANTNLAPSNWFNATNPVTISNGRFQVTVPATGGPAFYRLKR